MQICVLQLLTVNLSACTGMWLIVYTSFVNRYASGTLPWGNPNAVGFEPQLLDDGYLEVIGFTYSSLVSTVCSSSCHLTLFTGKQFCAVQVGVQHFSLVNSFMQFKLSFSILHRCPGKEFYAV